MNGKKISLSTSFLCIGAIISKSLLIMPQYMVSKNAGSAWIEISAKCIIIGAILIFILWLYKPFSDIPLEKVAQKAFGKTGFIIVNTVYSLSFVLYNAGLLRLLTEALRAVGLKSAYNEYYALFVLGGVLFGTYKGIKAAANVSVIVFPVLVVSLILIAVLLIPYYDFTNLTPILGFGVKSISKSIVFSHSLFFEFVLLFFMTEHSGGKERLRNTSVLTMVMAFSFSIIFTLLYCLSVPFPASKGFILPIYQLTRMIKTGIFLQRVEPLAVFIWTAIIMCGMCSTLSVATRLMNGGSDEGRRAFVPIIIMITFFISCMPSCELNAFDMYERLLRFGTILFPTFPILLLIIARIRKRGAEA